MYNYLISMYNLWVSLWYEQGISMFYLCVSTGYDLWMYLVGIYVCIYAMQWIVKCL